MPAVRSATFNVALLGRTKKLTAVAGGAYLAGELRGDLGNTIAFDYRSKRHEIAAQGIHAPTGWTGEQLWARVEAREKGPNAIFGRRFVLDLPHQISDEARAKIVDGWVSDLRLEHGVAGEWTVHRPPKRGNGLNWHAHVQIGNRPVNDAGKWAKSKVRAWDTGRTRRQALLDWRADWERRCNAALAAAGVEDRVSLQSFKTRGINQEPQRHRGMRATNRER